MTAANPHKGQVTLPTEEFGELLLIFDGNAYASLEKAWGTSMKGVVQKIAGWNEETLRLGDMGDLLVGLATRHQPHFTKTDAMDLIGFPTPNEDVMAKMMEAVQLSLPKASPPGEATPPAKPKRNGTGTKP